ncbi:unnamed protein product [Pieris macdunnoughi]|uniref:Uncharacterized protein n=1 Tax=Pieris macdunnoughi TaxID=345717 RepID=A0A821SWS5_9NEOP|nr:unnamed protein product [Pieris macdunnoughi]
MVENTENESNCDMSGTWRTIESDEVVLRSEEEKKAKHLWKRSKEQRDRVSYQMQWAQVLEEISWKLASLLNDHSQQIPTAMLFML